MADYVPNRFRNIPHQSGRRNYDARSRYRVSFEVTVERTNDNTFSFMYTNAREYISNTFKQFGVMSEPVYHNFHFNTSVLKGIVLVPASLDFDALCFSFDMMNHVIEYENVIWWYGSFGAPPDPKRTAHLNIQLTLGPCNEKEKRMRGNIANHRYHVTKIPVLPKIRSN